MPNNFCDNADHTENCHGKPTKDIRQVKMRREFGGDIVKWCAACRRADDDFISKVLPL